MEETNRTGVLLVNLGTPDSPSNQDVYRYLIEFLTDPRVIDTSWLSRQLLVRGIIVPSRYRQSASSYRTIWTDEGSPLKVYGELVKKKLQENLGHSYCVELAMRYRNPSIEQGLQHLLDAKVRRLIVLPLFPHYASATTGSVHQKVMEVMAQKEQIPEMAFICDYGTHPKVIEAFCAVGAPYAVDDYDHILLSFHGLPERQIIKGESLKCGQKRHCLQAADCCQTLSLHNANCYSAQCYATAHALAAKLNIQAARYSVVFQSRLGKEPWLQPYLSEELKKLAAKGKKRVLVFCPSFVCDCLETLHEIGVEYAAEFQKAGGQQLDLVPGLNDHATWIDALAALIKPH